MRTFQTLGQTLMVAALVLDRPWLRRVSRGGLGGLGKTSIVLSGRQARGVAT